VPRSEELFLLFDQVLLLKPGGHVIYFGPMKEIIKYVQTQVVHLLDLMSNL